MHKRVGGTWGASMLARERWAKLVKIYLITKYIHFHFVEKLLIP